MPISSAPITSAAQVQSLIEDRFGLKEISSMPWVEDAAQRIGISSRNFLLLVVGVTIFLGTLPYFRGLAFLLLTLLMPAYYTFKDNDGAKSPDHDKWFGYWFIYATWMLFDNLFRTIIATFLPLYWLIRISFLLFMYTHPRFGSKFMYQRCIRPAFILLERFFGTHIETAETFLGIHSSSVIHDP